MITSESIQALFKRETEHGGEKDFDRSGFEFIKVQNEYQGIKVNHFD